MRISISSICTLVVLVVLLSIPVESRSMNITPDYDSNLTQTQKNILGARIAVWEKRFCPGISLTIAFSNDNLGGKLLSPPEPKPGVDYVVRELPTGERIILAATDSYAEDADGNPTQARIRFNTDLSIHWYYAGEPVPTDSVDFQSVADHEIVHACGFTTGYTKFLNATDAGPPRTISCGGLTATLTATSNHLDSVVHPNHLMNPAYHELNPRQAKVDFDLPPLKRTG